MKAWRITVAGTTYWFKGRTQVMLSVVNSYSKVSSVCIRHSEDGKTIYYTTNSETLQAELLDVPEGTKVLGKVCKF